MTIIHTYTVLFLGSEGLADNYSYTQVLFLGSDVLSDNYPYIHGAISRSRGVG